MKSEKKPGGVRVRLRLRLRVRVRVRVRVGVGVGVGVRRVAGWARAAADCLQQRDAKGLSERSVEEHVAAREHSRHVAVRYRAQQLHPCVQLVALHHRLEGASARPVARDDEVHVREAVTRLGHELH